MAMSAYNLFLSRILGPNVLIRILAVVITGGFTHAELCKVFAERGHVAEFATNAGQEDWAKYCPLIKTSNYFWDSYWTHTYLHLKEMALTPVSRPDFTIADFFADAAVKHTMVELGIPIAIISGQPGFQIDMSLTSERAPSASRIKNEMVLFWALPSLIKWLKWTKQMRMKAGVTHKSPSVSKPDYLVLVISFFGLEVSKDLPPSIVPCGPILADSYNELDEKHAKSLAQHKRVLHVALGTHIILQGADVAKILDGIIQVLDDRHIDGVIWAVGHSPRQEFHYNKSLTRAGQQTRTLGEILDQADSDIMFPLFAPQHAISEHKSTVLFLTHGGSSSANEALYHGVPVLTLGFFFDQLRNSARLRSAGVGLSLDKLHYTSCEICDSIALIVGDQDGRFAQNLKRMKGVARIASRFHDRYRFLDGKEMHPRYLQTADMRMSTWTAKKWDLRLLTLGTSLIVVAGMSYIGRAIYTAFRFRTRLFGK
ncbi:UDP-Glycosyltransferase/glycogen phosphorylase [Aureobasidium melanogenum CBS 110374]|uniref:UDP-Glycosyltransferase/glycogen phosphorylase n=1 Tax=Aureobasidium melanogenum (strain CBS 110374) TaxID=1043003 RepID=A0A074W2A5_AURM1|nr:UDP-Glycosyltransferase/glycogen phosphorylase [Aureobasidium melanogenum CBS 110374]KEQ66933.1 UDP-Glycosyltransferase/glycogen phosphorylase [Aureobasidium melanogenum CBS 110374]